MIGFIGLGIMGSRMAANLLKNGYELVIFNRTKEKASDLLENGAVWAESPREVASKADIVITMLTNPEIVEEISFGESGFVKGFQKENFGLIVVPLIQRLVKEWQLKQQNAESDSWMLLLLDPK